jgi:zinc/manganese transport system substrate-binding protein
LQRTRIFATVGVVVILVAGAYIGVTLAFPSNVKPKGSSGGAVEVVAAENFWGSLVSQLGGNHTHVVSIVTDPNADPHEYESSPTDAQEISSASLVIVNGAGYDTWALKIVSSESNPNRTVLNVQELLGLSVGVNPHFWYSPYYVNDTVHAMYKDLVRIDPADKAYFGQQYTVLNQSLGTYNQQSVGTRIKEISQQFSGTKVGATEDIFDYLANATRLDLISPPEFMQAVAEGNEPPTPSVAQFEQQIQNNSIQVLVYNQQTVTQLTSNIRSLATQYGIPVVGVTETIQPPDVTFQTWMSSELIYLQNALNSNALGQ